MVLAGEDLGDPKTADGITEMLRVLRIARVSAVRARAKAFNALKDLIVTAPADLREQLAGRHKLHLVGACTALATSEIPSTPAEAVSVALKSLAERCLAARRRNQDTGHTDRGPHRARMPRSTPGVRRRPRHRRHPARRPGRQPRTHRVRRCVRQTLRGLAHRSIQRQNRATPTQQRRKPRRQPRPAHHLRCPTPPPPTHPRLPRPPHRRRQDKSRNHALHKEIHRPRDLPRRAAHTPRNPYSNPCRNMRASGVEGAMMTSTTSTQRWPSLGGSTWPAYPAPRAASATPTTTPRPRPREL